MRGNGPNRIHDQSDDHRRRRDVEDNGSEEFGFDDRWVCLEIWGGAYHGPCPWVHCDDDEGCDGLESEGKERGRLVEKDERNAKSWGREGSGRPCVRKRYR